MHCFLNSDSTSAPKFFSVPICFPVIAWRLALVKHLNNTSGGGGGKKGVGVVGGSVHLPWHEAKQLGLYCPRAMQVALRQQMTQPSRQGVGEGVGGSVVGRVVGDVVVGGDVGSGVVGGTGTSVGVGVGEGEGAKEGIGVVDGSLVSTGVQSQSFLKTAVLGSPVLVIPRSWPTFSSGPTAVHNSHRAYSLGSDP